MGIFSLFGKKDRQEATANEKDAVRTRRGGSRSGGTKPPSRPSAVKREQAALATALKIDAIESEMSSEFVATPATTPGPAPRRKPAPPDPLPSFSSAATAAPGAPMTVMGSTTMMLLEGQTTVSAIAEPTSDGEAMIGEAAILHANGQHEMVEHMLAAAIAQDRLGQAAARGWLMLFDLYQMAGKRQAFEQLAVEYANRFETSPPGWEAGDQPSSRRGGQDAPPSVPFAGRLDAGCLEQIARIRKLSADCRSLRLDFTRIASVEADGCALLLDALMRLQKSEHDLVLVGAAGLANRIRAIIAVGRRDDTEGAWLLLLEILRLLNREQEFEETSIDYCVTFEVSPPPFCAPQAGITTAASDIAPEKPDDANHAYALPGIVEGRVDELILDIAAWSDAHEVAVIDCSRLERMEFDAAGRLMSGLAPLCAAGRTIEFHQVNRLVLELFHVLGLDALARVLPRKS